MAVKGRTQRTRRRTATCMLCAVTGWVTVSPHQPLPPLGSAHTCAEVALVEQVSRHKQLRPATEPGAARRGRPHVTIVHVRVVSGGH